MIKIASATVETFRFQDEIPVILNTSIELETYIKGHHVYKEVFIPDVRERHNVLMEPDNCVDKFAVCLGKYRTVVGHLKKGDPGSLRETMQLERWGRITSPL